MRVGWPIDSDIDRGVRVAPTFDLADGNVMPMLGLGVWQVDNSREAVDAVRWALELGYRHIDTAQAYGNEESVGQGIRESGVPRKEIFVTTKFLPRNGDPAAALQESLRRLGLEWVDLYIIHWSAGGATWAWPGMEQARESGHARSFQLQCRRAAEAARSFERFAGCRSGSVQPVSVQQGAP